MDSMSDEEKEQAKDGFIRDAELLQIKHKNIIGLVDVIKSKSSLYLIMEYANGGTLDGLVNRRRLDLLKPDEVHYILRQIVEGFKELEKRGLIHRDLKPKNIMLDFPNYPEQRGSRKIFKTQLTPWHFENL